MVDNVGKSSVAEEVSSENENTLISSQAGNLDNDILDQETRCGLGAFKPAWLQPLSSKKMYVLIYGLIGTADTALCSYFIATISTMEKRFKIPSQMSGLISSALDMGTLCSTLALAYLGSAGHKPRWVAWGTALVGLTCYMRLLPHWLYGPGEDALAVTEEFGPSNIVIDTSLNKSFEMTLCGNNYTEYENCDHGSTLSLISSAILFLSHFVFGVGNAVYYSLGVAYMDDNARKTKTPMLLAISQSLRLIGPTFGYLLASYALDLFISPELTPTIDSKDPRWVGAWWFGWNLIGLVTLLLALAIGMFPRSLPRTAQRNIAAAKAKGQEYVPKQTERRSFADFKKVMSRLLRNKPMMCNCISSVFFLFGMIGHWTFMPKYMETQFHQSASRASLITGSVGLLCTAAGIFASAAVISYFKPGARKVAGWNVIVEFFDVFGFFIIIFIGCDSFKLQGTTQPDGTIGLGVECNSNCSCPDSLRYSPVCDPRSATTFFSACHAGCGVVDLLPANASAKVFNNCSCVAEGGSVLDGPCPVDCNQALMFFIIVQCIQRFLSASGRAGNMLLHFRCVSPADKSMAMAFYQFLLCAFSFIPGQIVFGILIDMSCIVWGQTCGETGNCWFYDVDLLRYYVNVPIIGCLFLGTLWDIGVWYYVKDLELYDDDEEEQNDQNKNAGADKSASVTLVTGSCDSRRK